jgi:RNA polymerase sigma-70 factor (ECF subfamily)
MNEKETGTGARIDAGELYRAHAPYVAAFLGRMGARQSDMEDLVQEVFVVAHRRGGFVAGAARPTTWLSEIALRVWWNARRKARTQRAEAPGADEADAQPSDARTPEEEALALDGAARVQRCLDMLDDDHRAVLVLFELQGESTDDIATMLDVPKGTVHSRLHNARKKFRARWERLQGRDER